MARIHKNPFFSILIISFLILAIISPLMVFGTTQYPITESVTGSGTIQITDTDSPYSFGIGTHYFNAFDQLTATAYPTSGWHFLSFTISNIGGVGGSSSNNPLSGMFVITQGTITANFQQDTQPTYYTVAMSNNPNGYGALSYSVNGGSQQIAGYHSFPAGTLLTFWATPSDGYQFTDFNIGGYQAQTAPYNPLLLTVGGDITIYPDFSPLPESTYSVTLESQNLDLNYFGGVATGINDTNNYQFNYGTYIINANTNITFSATPYNNYIFKYWATNIGSVPNVTDNPITINITSSGWVYPVFETDSMSLSIIGVNSGSTDTNFKLTSGELYQCYVSVFENNTLSDVSGNYAIYLTPITNDATVATDGQGYVKEATGTFSNGYFQFAIQADNYTTETWQGLRIGIMYNNSYVYDSLWTEIETSLALNYLNGLSAVLGGFVIPTNPTSYNGIFVSYSYTLDFTQSPYVSTPTQTPQQTPPTFFGVNNSDLAIIIYAISIIGLAIAFFYLHNNNIPFAVALGLIIGTIVNNVFNLLGIFTLPIDALVIISVIGIIVFMRH